MRHLAWLRSRMRAGAAGLVLPLAMAVVACGGERGDALRPGSIVTLEFPELGPSLHHAAEGGFPVVLASFHVPVDYDPGRPTPMVLWLSGGTGGAGDHAANGREILGDRGWIVLNLPLFKASLEPLAKDGSNRWSRLGLSYAGDNEVIWKAYRVMLERVREVIPNIDPENTFMGGFSNGAHTTAILLARPDAEVARSFRSFFFIEGGAGLTDYSVLRGREVLYLQGERHERDWVRPFHDGATAAGAKSTWHVMAGVGHELPASEHAFVRAWIRDRLTPGRATD